MPFAKMWLIAFSRGLLADMVLVRSCCLCAGYHGIETVCCKHSRAICTIERQCQVFVVGYVDVYVYV
jgi:hypothetical protein